MLDNEETNDSTNIANLAESAASRPCADGDDGNAVDLNDGRGSSSVICRIESFFCGQVGNAWGYLDTISNDSNKGVLYIAWWSIRHLLYFGISVILLIFVPNGAYVVVPIFLVVHPYKAIRFLVVSAEKEKKKKRTTMGRKFVQASSGNSASKTISQEV